MKRAIGLWMGLGMLMTSGCAYYGKTEAVVAHYHRNGIEQTFAYGARDGTFPAVIVGNPFGGDKAQLDGAVADAMTAVHRGPPTRFVPTLATGTLPSIRIVMLFDPPVAANGSVACGDVRALPSAPTGERMRVLAALCSGSDAMSDAVASAPAATSADDPRLKQTVAALMRDIIPYQSPDQGGNCANNLC